MRQLIALSTVAVESVVSQRELFGTGISRSTELADLLGSLAFWLNSQSAIYSQIELQSREAVRVNTSLPNLFMRAGWIQIIRKPFLINQNTQWVIRLPSWVIQCHSIVIGGKKLLFGQDYGIRDGSIILNREAMPEMPTLDGYIATEIVANFYTQEKLYSSLFGYSDFTHEARNFYTAMHRSLRDGLTPLTFSELVAAAIGIKCVTKESTVVHVIDDKVGYTPTVITTEEVLHGVEGDTAIVSVGDVVYPGDFVFSSVRVWDCTYPRPEFISSFYIPPSMFGFESASGVTVSATPAAATVVTVRDKLRVRFPLTGEASVIERFWVAQDAREDETGYYFANYLTNSNVPSAIQLTGRTFNWIDVLWDAWLRFGAVVAKISYSDARTLTQAQQFRLEQIRRTIPPWVAYFIQAEMNPDYVC